MNNFDSMTNAELRTYVLTHREDEQAWSAYRERLKTDPTVIRVSPDLDAEGWNQVEQTIRKAEQGNHVN